MRKWVTEAPETAVTSAPSRPRMTSRPGSAFETEASVGFRDAQDQGVGGEHLGRSALRVGRQYVDEVAGPEQPDHRGVGQPDRRRHHAGMTVGERRARAAGRRSAVPLGVRRTRPAPRPDRRPGRRVRCPAGTSTAIRSSPAHRRAGRRGRGRRRAPRPSARAARPRCASPRARRRRSAARRAADVGAGPRGVRAGGRGRSGPRARRRP